MLRIQRQHQSRWSPFGSKRRIDAWRRVTNHSSTPDQRGERRQLSRYHPSCNSPNWLRETHLSVVLFVGTTHLSLLAACDRGVRSATRGCVPGDFASSGLPPSPDRSRESRQYSSPSTRGTRRQTLRRWSDHGYAVVRCVALIDSQRGDRQRVGRDRRAGRPSGERESNSPSSRTEAFMKRPPGLLAAKQSWPTPHGDRDQLRKE